ncbi:OLC1v1001698C1 [Oldenlandia corymbosa var. corymbosa]|uniref:OLC1v1001698C1 n=1 Tax=Oldenlandia corymbosa var. corymbosa TaxID=529605 RepID=A0AAV1D8S6_OLDCO|nr:OLC1v1001698C1 [Oldenlandia corymbosa var. corymbosa]
MQLEKQFEAARKSGEALERAMKEDPGKQRWQRPIEELISLELMTFHIAINVDNFINQFGESADGGQYLSCHRHPSVADSASDVQEEIDLIRLVSPSRSDSFEKVDDDKKLVRVHQFI